jgi:ABC-type Zn uptake system ZnuABC Zn-binding protein ZnuA
VRTIADETGATVVSDLYTDSVGDAPQDTYAGMMRSNIERVAAALGGN